VRRAPLPLLRERCRGVGLPGQKPREDPLPALCATFRRKSGRRFFTLFESLSPAPAFGVSRQIL
jgi:hypothetical protein